MDFKVIAPVRRYQQITDQIILNIRSGKIKTGDKLPTERELSDQFSVSRSSVREALIALEVKGFVELRAGQGVIVINPSDEAALSSATAKRQPATPSKTLQKSPKKNSPGNNALTPTPTDWSGLSDISPFEILEARLLIETETAAQAAINASDDERATIAKWAKRLNTLAKKGINPTDEDRQFHEAIAEASGNALLLASVRLYWQAMMQSEILGRLEKHYLNQHGWLNASLEHQEIVKAILNQDPTGARRAMRDHLVCIGLRLRHEQED